MTPLQTRPERQKSLGAKNTEGFDMNLVDYVAILECHSYPNKEPYSALEAFESISCPKISSKQ